MCGSVLGIAALTMAAKPSPPWSPTEVSVQETETGGYKFTNELGVPFFTNDADKGGKIGCGDECLGITWLPVFARDFAKPQGDWSIVIRADKTTQWAYKGKPIYNYYASTDHDEIVAAAKEDGHWHPLVP